MQIFLPIRPVHGSHIVVFVLDLQQLHRTTARREAGPHLGSQMREVFLHSAQVRLIERANVHTRLVP